MITRSNCCQAAMHTLYGEWQCAKCGKPCDPVGERQESPASDGKPKTPCCGVKFLALWDYRKAHHERFRFICSRCGDPVDLPVGSKMEQTDPQRLSDGKPMTPCCGAPYFFRMSSEGNGYRCEKCGKLLDLPNMGRIMPAQAEKKVNAFYGKRQPPSARDFVKKRLCEVEEMEQAWEADKRQWMEEGARLALTEALNHPIACCYTPLVSGYYDEVSAISRVAIKRMLDTRDFGFPVDDR